MIGLPRSVSVYTLDESSVPNATRVELNERELDDLLDSIAVDVAPEQMKAQRKHVR